MKYLVFFFAVTFTISLIFFLPSITEASASDSFKGHMVIGKNYLVKGSYEKASLEFTLAS